ncbi:MAG: sodium:proton antiporter [Planctomycetes bacterium]|nr:sodium:proton antiporter [Planctomycetota bacterium]
MFILMIVVFVLGYLAIALEHPIKIDKAATALMTGALCWGIYAMAPSEILNFSNHDSINTIAKSEQITPGFKDYLTKKVVEYSINDRFDSPGEILEHPDLQAPIHQIPAEETEVIAHHFIEHSIFHTLSEIAAILFFLLCAMTIVEVVDAHEGFNIITERINTLSRVKLMWILGVLTFFFSAALDNLTTSIVMAALLRKLMKEKKDVWMFAGVVILTANAGGAWSPIGDVTTIMLWIEGQITAVNIIMKLIIPSLVCMVVPLTILSFTLKGNVERPDDMVDDLQDSHMLSDPTTERERLTVFFLGVGGLLFVPVFKVITHLPPVIGMTFSLGLLWAVTELMHHSKSEDVKSTRTVVGVLRKVDTTSVLFFLGILVAVAALQSAGHLGYVAAFLDRSIGNIYAINVIIGLLSSVVDNVPLVAGAMGMYDIAPSGDFGVDGAFWEFLAYCAGTGGSVLIIGSAAGVAVMGILKIDFIWYLKKMTLLAFAGYISGAVTYWFLNTSGIAFYGN